MVVAPGRARRPGAERRELEPPSPEELDSCPFCEGREDRTPPETLALGREADSADSPGWLVRVVPNLYPAFERQEVVIHTPRHARSLAELTDAEIELVAQAWQSRRASEPGGYLHALVNEGREAGASLAHSHSQLVWFREAPPGVSGERAGGVGEVIARADLRIAERDGLVAVAHPAGRGPYETLVAPREPEAGAFRSNALAAALALVAETIRRVTAIEGPFPLNAWLHDGPHWHVEVLPRLTVLAGIELGAGVYVSTLVPEEAAERLRRASV